MDALQILPCSMWLSEVCLECEIKKANELPHKMREHMFSHEASIMSLLVAMLPKDRGYQSFMNSLPDFCKNDASSNCINEATKL